MRCSLCAVLALAAVWLPEAIAGGVLAIDYGTDFMKLSLVKPGVFDIVLNKDSKRKIQSVVAIRGEDRTFGGDAAALAARFPQNSYPGVKLLLAQTTESPSVAQHSALYHLPLTPTSRGTAQISPLATSNANTSYTPEELLAMQFAYAKELADATAGERITDVVVTVPAFFTQFQRRSILDAAELAGLRTLGLVDDGAAVAVNYAMTRTFSGEPEYHVVYDAGSGSVRATVVGFTTEEQKIHPKSKTMKNVTNLEVKGVGWDQTVGGLKFDEAIRDMLKADFEEKSGVKVDTNGRAMAKLLKEAVRVKQVLSANAESQSRIESLAEDIDFKSSLTRQQFEDAFAAEVPKFIQPITDAITRANLSLDRIKSVILVGGTSRVPMVQAAVRALVGEDKVAVNVNADESFVMGAALYGAGLSRQFKTKDIRLTGVIPYAIKAEHESDAKSADTPKRLSTKLFGDQAKSGVKKTMNLRKTSDFSMEFAYPSPPPSVPAGILNVTIQGLSAALANHTNVTGVELPSHNVSVKVIVQMSESGLFSVSGATVTLPSAVKPEDGGITGKLAGLFGKKAAEANTAESSEEAAEEPADGSIAALEAKAKAEADGKKKAVNASEAVITFPLTVTSRWLGVAPLSTTEKIASGKLLRELRSAETQKRNREEARNSLEAYIYKLRDLLDRSEFTAAMTETEREVLSVKREEAADWLSDYGETAPLKELRAKKADLKALEAPVQVRVTEAPKRPGLYQRLEDSLKLAQSFADVMRTMVTPTPSPSSSPLTSDSEEEELPLPRYTPSDLNSLDDFLSSVRAWFEEAKAKQEALPSTADPAVRVWELEAKVKAVDEEVVKWSNKKAPTIKKPRKSPAPSSTTSAAPADATTSTEGNNTVPEANGGAGTGTEAEAGAGAEPEAPRDEL